MEHEEFLPLPEKTCSRLRTEADRSKLHATVLTHDAIVAYAADVAGTNLDFDSDLEATGIEHLLKTVEK